MSGENGEEAIIYEKLHMKENMELRGTVIVKNGIEGHNDKVFDLVIIGDLYILNGNTNVRQLKVTGKVVFNAETKALDVKGHEIVGLNNSNIKAEGRVEGHLVIVKSLSASNVDADFLRTSEPVKLISKDGRILAGIYSTGHSSLQVKKEWYSDGQIKVTPPKVLRKEPNKSRF